METFAAAQPRNLFLRNSSKRKEEKTNSIRAGIPYERHFAQRITAEEYAEADYIFYMDRSNLDLALWRIPDTKHIYKSIFEYTPSVHEVADPWYDGRHEEALSQIIKCCKDILKHI